MLLQNKLERASRYRINKASLEFRIYGLKPNTVYNFVDEYNENLTSYTQQLKKSENFDLVYNHYYNNIKTENLDVDGNQLPNTIREIYYQIYFNDFNYINSNTKIDNVIEIQAIGEPLKTDENGLLVFYYYHPDTLNLDIDIANKTKLKIDNYRDFLFKQYKLTLPDGTHTISVNPGKKIIKQKNIDNTDNSNYSTRLSSAEKFNFSMAQTFFIDPDSVQNATEVFISSIELFFRNYANASGKINASAIEKPGCSVYIVPTKNRIPIVEEAINLPFARVTYDEINVDSLSAQSTKFIFNDLLNVKTNTEYAILIRTDNGADFRLWGSQEGQYILGSTVATAGPAGKYIGNYFNYSSSSNSWIPNYALDLKFKVNVAKFANNGTPINANLSTINIKNNSYEFFHYNELSSSTTFKHNEKVYQVEANATGNISVSNTSTTITGNGTFFDSYFDQGSDSEYIVIQHSNGTNELREVISVTSNTILNIDRSTSFTNTSCKFYKTPIAWVESLKDSYLDGGKSKTLILSHSQANSNLKFTNNSTLYGSLTNAYITNTNIIDIKVNRITASIDVTNPAQSSYESNVIFNYTINANGDTIVDNTPFSRDVNFFRTYHVTKENAIVFPSRSNEINAIVATGNTTVYANSFGNVVSLQVSPTLNNDFVAPKLNTLKELAVHRYVINNDYTDENTKYGNAYSKHISKKINLEANVAAEDLLVYINAYRPIGADIKIFAKVYNNTDLEAFDDKDWTLLEQKSTAKDAYSKTMNNIIEYTYGFTQYPNTNFTANGLITTVLNQSNVVGVNTSFTTEFANNDLVKIYPTLFPNNYIVGVVSSITNNTLLTLSSEITNTSLTGAGLKIDKLSYKYQAFNNITTDNVVRYYSSSMTEFDKFNSFKLKIVFLSNSEYTIPRVKNIRAVATST